jgi:CRISPR-associated protein Cas2
MAGNGRAIMVFAANNEQGLDFKVYKHEWTPVEMEGLILMLRPNGPPDNRPADTSERSQGWSTASRRRRFRRR